MAEKTKLEKLENYAECAWLNLSLQQKLIALDAIGVIGSLQAYVEWCQLYNETNKS